MLKFYKMLIDLHLTFLCDAILQFYKIMIDELGGIVLPR